MEALQVCLFFVPNFSRSSPLVSSSARYDTARTHWQYSRHATIVSYRTAPHRIGYLAGGFQGTMVAEVEAVRKSVDEERQRLADRCAAVDKEKRQAAAAARAEGDRLAEQVVWFVVICCLHFE